jgi:hypothetical protein
MLNALRYDPAMTTKRLGDGFRNNRGQTELARVSRTLLMVDNMTTQGGDYGQKLLRILTQVVANYVCSRYIHANIAFY